MRGGLCHGRKNCIKLCTGQFAGLWIGAAGTAQADLPAPEIAGAVMAGKGWRGRECAREGCGRRGGKGQIMAEGGGRGDNAAHCEAGAT